MTLGSLSRFGAGVRVGVATLVEDVAAVADLQTPPGVLLHHDDADTGPVDLLGPDEDLVLQGGRQTGGGLVEQEHLGVHHEGPAHRQHLALATREGPRPLLDALGERGNSRARSSALLRLLRGEEDAHLEVLGDGQDGKTLLFCGTYPMPRSTSSWALRLGDVLALVGDQSPIGPG
jgi:hypothetical protein